MTAQETSYQSLWGQQRVSESFQISRPTTNSYIPGGASVTSGINTFQILPPALKSLAIRSRVRYSPHPYVWMAPARALPTGLGIESEGLELPLNELPEWDESKIKTFPMVCLTVVP